MRAYIIVDLGFGDAGKGLLTDFLTRQLSAGVEKTHKFGVESTHKFGVVVRYNGGAQAGHNVVTADGRHHTFSQFGSGTFLPGVKTFLSRQVVIHPTALLIEGAVLEGKGVPDAFARLRVSDQALIITPFHQAANRMREIARGAERHGSCGVGVGETYEDDLTQPQNSIRAGELADPVTLRRKLRAIRDQKYEQMLEVRNESSHPQGKHKFDKEWQIFENGEVIERWISSIARIGELGLVVSDSVLETWLKQTETAIFEGAQGILLDGEAGFHPYTTWSRCTADNARNLLKELAPGASVFQMGVLRSHMVRHGPGPLPTETGELGPMIADHNQQNEWQGGVRYGWFDAPLARYALGVAGRLDSLMITHMDILPRLEKFTYCTGYEGRTGNGQLNDFARLELAQREQITRALSAAVPRLESCAANEGEVLQKLGTLLGQPVGMISRGPSARDVQILDKIPG